MAITVRQANFPGQWIVTEVIEDGDPVSMTISCPPGDPGEARAVAIFSEVRGGLNSINSQTHDQLRTAALQRADSEHADLMRRLTGEASIEERDTWKPKEEAARAYLQNAATDVQAEMIELEAQARGDLPETLATLIVGKSDAFMRLIGMAAGLRAQCRAAILTATDQAVPIHDVQAGIDSAFEAHATSTAVAVEQWLAG